MISGMIHTFPILSTDPKIDFSHLKPKQHRDVTVIHGNSNSCKTSLLFQTAVTHAAEGHHVVFITHEPMSRLPLHVHGMPSPDADLLEELKMMYMSTGEELTDYLSALHEQPILPDVLIVDDLQQFVAADDLKSLARTCAFLKDAAAFIRLKCGQQADVLVSIHSDNEEQQPVLEQFFTDVCQITAGESSAEDPVFLLKPYRTECAAVEPSSGESEAIEFSIRDNQVLLNKVTFPVQME